MCDSDNSEDQSDQPCAKKVKLHYGILPSHHSQQSSQGSQNIIIETGRHPDQLNTRHTINVVVNNSKRERQKQYRERNRDKLKYREAERRKRIQSSKSITGPSTSSNSNIMEVNNEEPVTAISSTLQNKRDRQKRYREKNRKKLSQREAERRRRLQNAESIIELHTSPNIENREIITEPIIIKAQILRKFRITTVNLDTIKQLMNISSITLKIMNLDMLVQFVIDFGLKKI
ncbi:uncharacterized protein LOC123266773 [Cotesia glomerata]|uniref:uncharacterized protein LOC123266773 n=1 Tax=Cotesia glomerata TaxID=32391 RepID=UPI001D0299EC|nr:uncharacterized protein LOC123266773 [Cotesia glomerata]